MDIIVAIKRGSVEAVRQLLQETPTMVNCTEVCTSIKLYLFCPCTLSLISYFSTYTTITYHKDSFGQTLVHLACQTINNNNRDIVSFNNIIIFYFYYLNVLIMPSYHVYYQMEALHHYKTTLETPLYTHVQNQEIQVMHFSLLFAVRMFNHINGVIDMISN